MPAPDFNAQTTDAPIQTQVWKMIYLARRNPALAPEDFPQAWREHSALGRQCRNVGERVLSVAQCSRLLDVPLPGASADYDGVNLLLLRDRDAATMIWSDPETLAVMRPDEPRVFDRYVRDFTLVCREQVLRDAPRSAVVLHGFLRRRPGLSAESLLQAIAEAGSAGPFDAAQRIVLNEVMDTPPPGYEYDAIVEWWFDSVPAVHQAFGGRDDLRAGLPAPLAQALDGAGSVFLLTRVTHSRP
ncbi:EthD domain-containing protein [Sphaerotilus microaerophilus]|uniref:EthD domain-containing protein n=1 Tax=Sphaerotilus microaerophilus TaxID=2914710 RepID=A0ABM7YP48_9BURK|nr:EthD domain-containing protein [Sphaerotilus sp. FB-5]BDI06225.1 hypothetical protein CATMQ487_31950 [Sphaerotilus sp. FB-5]